MVLSEAESGREPQRGEADLESGRRRGHRFGHQDIALVVPDSVDDAPDGRREEEPARDELDAEEPARGVLLGMIDLVGRTGAGRTRRLQTLAVWVGAIE